MTHQQNFDQHLLPLWMDQQLQTPAFVYDQREIQRRLDYFNIARNAGCKLLYSIKAVPLPSLVFLMQGYIDGLSASSLFESRLAREMIGDSGTVHITTPGLGSKDIPELSGLCDYISFNSLSQWQRNKTVIEFVKTGLRINPGLSFARDVRFDPCREGSKLGVTMDQVSSLPVESLNGISGLHIHTNCESENYSELVQTVEILLDKYPALLQQMSWLNLGGGYITDNEGQIGLLQELIRDLKTRYVQEVFIEPGKGIIGKSGYLVASVIDVFNSGSKKIAVVDSTINHLPEVFEYQYSPVILDEDKHGAYEYRISGASCLSGDIFGDYRFHRELQPGNKLIFANVGAYMLVKANFFNGINLPNIYLLNLNGHLELIKQYDYSIYREFWR